ncbi:methyltransferase [Salinimicrobium marinum]|uniref:Methyltransferase n=1 Tax=Salinimicrobium marinum TaxID=680283 RepID=A0A918VZ57_9FLAO|nr:class I SAM-dependent methyltransferase [Salinimicrobium marinum]GHA38889.1 methyltransferase [Salinimicrobium marinum]
MSSEKASANYQLKCKDHTVSGNEYELRYDQKRDMLVTFPQPTLEELPEFYKSENYISHTDSSSSLFEKIYQWVKTYMIDKKIKWIEKEAAKGKDLLDIGAGTGDFLFRAKSRGWNVKGTEPNFRARELALKKGVNLAEDSLNFPSASFDVITMWHVLEHIPNLEEQIMELTRLLKKDGLLVIAAPNFKSYDAGKFKNFWAAYDVPRHLWHFSRTSIHNIFEPHGFKIEKTRGLEFDAFYVSLLSAKYKSGSNFSISALFTGLLSNLKAKSTKEYSSVAYFLQKN